MKDELKYPSQDNPECSHVYHSQFLVIQGQAPHARRKNLQRNISRVKKKKKKTSLSRLLTIRRLAG